MTLLATISCSLPDAAWRLCSPRRTCRNQMYCVTSQSRFDDEISCEDKGQKDHYGFFIQFNDFFTYLTIFSIKKDRKITVIFDKPVLYAIHAIERKLTMRL